MAKTSITECGKRVAKSKSVELQGRLHLDLAMQEKYLPNSSESKRVSSWSVNLIRVFSMMIHCIS